MEAIKDIAAASYNLCYEAATATVKCSGSMRLGETHEYEQITNLFNQAVAQHPPILTLDLSELSFLNSSGINILTRLVINAREAEVGLVVHGSKTIAWQSKSLFNLQRLMPALKLVLN